MDQKLYDLENRILDGLEGKFVNLKSDQKKYELVKNVAKSIKGDISEDEVGEIFRDINDLSPTDKLVTDQFVEDIMVNNTQSIFYYHSQQGEKMLDKAFENIEELNVFVKKLRAYATNSAAKGNILDVHMPSGSRANIVSSPLGYDITIRNFKGKALSIIDLINLGVIDYSIAARLWVYVDGFKARPANILFGGMPAAGKTTMLNAMFSFFRPEQRIVTIEETYELDTTTQENCVRLETSEELTMQELVKNTLRMRPDMIIIGEVRGAEAKDMVTAMNIGKNSMSTIHASSTRDIVNRLENEPMNVPTEIIPAIDVLFVLSQVYMKGKPYRKVVQISEVSGMETKILLSDLYKYDYKTHQAAQILPSVTYRDALSKAIGVNPGDILAEEVTRAAILENMNKYGIRDMKQISQVVRDYYYNPEETLKKLGMNDVHPAIIV